MDLQYLRYFLSNNLYVIFYPLLFDESDELFQLVQRRQNILFVLPNFYKIFKYGNSLCIYTYIKR